jgi:uncharacterized phage protein (TIGR02220 family)
MRRGHVKLWRKSLDTLVFQDETLWKLWCLCLLSANHKQGSVLIHGVPDPVILKPGQFITGRYQLHEDFYPKRRAAALSPSSLWRRMEQLRDLGNLRVDSNSRYTVITIINWPTYQSAPAKTEQPNEQPMNSRCTADEQPMNTNKNVKNDKNDTTPLTPLAGGRSLADEAREVLAYLNRVTGKRFDRTVAIEARLRDGGTVADCIAIIDAKKKDTHFWRDGNPTRYMNPTTLFLPAHWDNYLNESITTRGNGNGHDPAPDPYELECRRADAYRAHLIAADPAMQERFRAKAIEPLRDQIPAGDWAEQIDELTVMSRTKELVRLFHPRRRPRGVHQAKVQSIIGVPVEFVCDVPAEYEEAK